MTCFKHKDTCPDLIFNILLSTKGTGLLGEINDIMVKKGNVSKSDGNTSTRHISQHKVVHTRYIWDI